MHKNTPRLAFVVMSVAGSLIALAAPVNAATNQLSGTGFFNPSKGHPCPVDQPAYSSYDPIVMTGSLDGCWYTHIETSKTTPGGVYLETGHELFVGSLNGGPTGTFTTNYNFEAKLNAAGKEVRGGCQHRIVATSGTVGLAGATGIVFFMDIVGVTITYKYHGHISLS